MFQVEKQRTKVADTKQTFYELTKGVMNEFSNIHPDLVHFVAEFSKNNF